MDTDAGQTGDASAGDYDGILAGDELGGVMRSLWRFILESMYRFEFFWRVKRIFLGALRRSRALWLYAIRIW